MSAQAHVVRAESADGLLWTENDSVIKKQEMF